MPPFYNLKTEWTPYEGLNRFAECRPEDRDCRDCTGADRDDHRHALLEQAKVRAQLITRSPPVGPIMKIRRRRSRDQQEGLDLPLLTALFPGPYTGSTQSTVEHVEHREHRSTTALTQPIDFVEFFPRMSA